MDDTIKDVLAGIAKAYQDELDEVKSPEDLEKFWIFTYDPEQGQIQNTYEFYKALKSYELRCRDWETKHNGYVSVVERVRDKYLFPKIFSFLMAMHNSK